MAGYEKGPSSDPGGAFEILDPKLTIYALANGMDLVKDPEVRRLEWYRDGHERGIAIRATGDADVSISVLRWRRKDPTSETTAEYRAGVSAADMAGNLSGTLEGAVDAANEL